MKFVFKSILIVILLSNSFACGVSSKDAARWNDFVAENHEKVAKALDSVIFAIQKNDSATLPSAYQYFVSATASASEEIDQNARLEIDTAYETASKNLFVFYKRLAKFELKKLVELNQSPSQELNIEQFRQSKQILDSIKNSVNQQHKLFVEEQKKFSTKFGLELK